MFIGPALGILPALLLPSRLDSLHGGTRSTTENRGIRLQSALIACEVALSLVLLTGAGLLLNSFVRLSTRDPVLPADELIIAQLTLGPSLASEAERSLQFDRIAERLRRVDGVTSVAATTSLCHMDVRGSGQIWKRHRARRSSWMAFCPIAKLVQSIWEVDETQPINRIEPYRNALGETFARERFFLLLLVLFAGLATLLAAVGLHAVLSQVLLRRTPETAIRVALGASRGGVLWRWWVTA
jgi:hypothetical protein